MPTTPTRIDTLLVTSTFPCNASDVSGRFLLDLARALPMRPVVLAARSAGAAPGYPQDLARLDFHDGGLFGGSGALGNLANGTCSRMQAALTLTRMSAATLRHALSARVLWSHWAVPASVLGALCQQVLSVPHVASLHGGDVWLLEQQRWGPGLARWLARHAQVVTAPNERLARAFEALSGRLPEVLGLGVVDPGPPTDDGARRPVLGSHCRWAPGKGLRGLLAALTADSPRLELAGHGPLATELAARAAGHARVRLAGPLLDDDKRRWLGSLSVFVAAYGRTPWGQREGQPVAVLEALAAGLPVVAYRGACPSGPLRHGVNALLVDDGQPGQLLAAGARLLADPALRKQLATGARESAAPHLQSAVLSRWARILADPASAGLC